MVKKIPMKVVREVEEHYRKKQFLKCRESMDKIYPNLLKGKKFKHIYDVFGEVVKSTRHYAIDLNTEKYLPFFEAYTPIACKKLYQAANDARRSIKDLSPPALSKVLPLGMYVVVGIIAIVVIQNVPSWIREIQVEMRNWGQFLLGLTQYFQ